MRQSIYLITAFLAAITVSCERKQQPSMPQEEVSTVVNGDRVTLTQDQISRAGLKFGHLEEVELSHDVNAPGRLDLPSEKLARVTSMVSGIVSRIYVHIGDPVKKGDLLCRLEHPDIIQMQEEYVKARLDLDLARQEYERQTVLIREKVSSGKVFQSSERDYLSAKARYDALKLKLQIAGFDLEAADKGEISRYLDIRSPINGIVDKINVNLGNLASTESELFSIVCKDHMYLEVMVFEKDIPFVRIGQRVTFQLSNLGDQVYESEVFSIGSTMDPNSRSIPVYAEFMGVPENIYPGMFVAATIHTGEGMFMALPESAIVSERQGEDYIFFSFGDISSTNVNFGKMEVTTGLSEDGYIQADLAAPLPEGASIVVEGAYYIRAEMMKAME